MINSDQRATDASFLSGFLAARDVPCPGCGYNLRGLTTDRCPECNRDLRLTVSLTEPRLAAFITGLVGLAFGLGFDLVLTAYLLVQFNLRGRGGLPSEFFTAVILPMLVLAPAFGLWIYLRRRLGRLPFGARWLCVSLAWALTIGAAAVFIASVR